MKWTKPELYDLRDPKSSVAMGACSSGPGRGGATCTPSGFAADPNCSTGTSVGQTQCDTGGSPDFT